MNKQLFLFLAFAVIVSSCATPGKETPASPSPSTATSDIQPLDDPLPTVTPVCVSPNPAQRDIDRALAYTGDMFSVPDWDQSYSVSETNVAVTWQNVSHSALAYLEARIKPCGYEEPDLNMDFNDESWKATFANYESFQPITQCGIDTGLRLYQFKTQNQGIEYAVNYWVQNDTSTRLIVTMIIFPVEEQVLLGDYSAQLFPELPNCS